MSDMLVEHTDVNYYTNSTNMRAPSKNAYRYYKLNIASNIIQNYLAIILDFIIMTYIIVHCAVKKMTKVPSD